MKALPRLAMFALSLMKLLPRLAIFATALPRLAIFATATCRVLAERSSSGGGDFEGGAGEGSFPAKQAEFWEKGGVEMKSGGQVL